MKLGADGMEFAERMIQSDNEVLELNLNVTRLFRLHFLISMVSSSLDPTYNLHRFCIPKELLHRERCSFSTSFGRTIVEVQIV